MDDDRSTSRPDGVRISGAEEARRIVAQPPMWADDVDASDEASGHQSGHQSGPDQAPDEDDDWMSAGDSTLSGVLGHRDIADAGAAASAGHDPHDGMAQDGWDDDESDDLLQPAPAPAAGSARNARVSAHEDMLPEDAQPQDAQPEDAQPEDDDRFPDEMYDEPPSRPRTPAAAAPAQDEAWAETPAPVKVIAIEPLDEPDDGWANFAGGGPRWRREAEDWADVDAADTSGLGDDSTRIGTLDPNRSEESDLYSFEQRGRAPERAEPAAAAGAVPPGSRTAARRPKAGAAAAGAGSGAAAGAPSGGPAARPRPGARPAAKAAPAATLGMRVATGITLAAALGLVLYVGKRPGAAVLVAIALPLAALELLTALRQRGFRPAIPAVLVGIVATVAGTYWRGDQAVTLVFVLTVLTIMLWFLLGAERDRPVVNIAVSLLAFGYIGIAGATAALLVRMHDGVGLLFAAIACTVGYDVVGYFVGSFLGRTKLAPEISPNKTVEGLVGGMIGSLLVGAVVFGKLGWAPWDGIKQGAALGLAVAFAAPVGDLVESMLKRDLGMKDMGNVLPGHGGVLDRIDGMLFAVPAVFLVARALHLA